MARDMLRSDVVVVREQSIRHGNARPRNRRIGALRSARCWLVVAGLLAFAARNVDADPLQLSATGTYWLGFAGGTTEERKFTHVLPALASSVSVPLQSWDIGADVAFGLIGSDRRAIDAEPYVARRFGPHVAVEAGYRLLDFVFHETTNRGDFF